MNVKRNNLYDLLMKLYRFSEETYNHSMRVSDLCVEFGNKLGLESEEIEKLRIAGLFHDIGKLCIPIQIIHKPSKLTSEEYEIVKNHSMLGVKLLKEEGFYNKDVLDMILKHHERPDGFGYPNGVKKNDINNLTSILTLCDCFDAMNSKRKYHEKMDFEYIQNELLNNSGTQFDSYYVKQFLNFINDIDFLNSKEKIGHLK